MSVKTASQLVTRAVRAAIKETISPANQGSRKPSAQRPLHQAGDVNRQFGHELHQRLNAYTDSVDEFGSPGNTVDNWRLQFSELEAANGIEAGQKRRA